MPVRFRATVCRPTLFDESLDGNVIIFNRHQINYITVKGYSVGGHVFAGGPGSVLLAPSKFYFEVIL